jgi:hypothetical protein
MPALAAPTVVTYEIDVVGTPDIPKEAYDAIFANPGVSFRPIVAALPGVFFTGPGQPIVPPNGGNRGLLRGRPAQGHEDQHEHEDERDLQIKICSTRCFSVADFVRRKLFEASLSPTVIGSLQTVLSARLTKRMCGSAPNCEVKVKLTQI